MVRENERRAGERKEKTREKENPPEVTVTRKI